MAIQKKSKKTCKPSCKIIIVIAILAVAIASLAYFNNKKIDSDDIIAYVNDQAISKEEILDFLKNSYGVPANFSLDNLPEKYKTDLIKQIYTEQIIIDSAKDANLDNRSDIKQKIIQAQSKVIKEAYLQEVSQRETTRENIEALYQEQIANLSGKTEVNAKHILVKTEKEAKQVIRDLRSKPFAQVAKEKSIDPYSKEKGGDLGYFTKGNMVKEFEDTTFNMKKGEISQPFKTQFGWHIVKLIDKREAQIPDLDTIYEKLKQQLSYQAISNYISEIQNSIDVELVKSEKIETNGNNEENITIQKQENKQ